MTDEQMRDLVKECGLDWRRGYMPLFDGDPTNRYAVLIKAVEARRAPLMTAVEHLLDDGHMNTEHLARLRAAWEGA